MSAMQEILNIRSRALEIGAACEVVIRELERENEATPRVTVENYETVYPITVNTAIFKGNKPTAVMFGDERVDVYKWKTVVEKIMCDCNSDPEKHVALMNLRGRVAGRERVFLAKESEGMRSPIKIDDNLYIETNYDTETLLRILMTRILDVVGYDYSNISVSIRSVSSQRR